MIFALLNFLSRLRHPRAYAQHQAYVERLNYHLDNHIWAGSRDFSCPICLSNALDEVEGA